MHMGSFIPIAYHMHSVTGVTFLEMMVISEQIPVGALIGHDYTCAFTQRTSAVQRSNHSGSNEFGPIRNPFHGLPQ